jgi:two-component system OmpR family response regulator
LAVLEVLAARAGRVVSKDAVMRSLYEWDEDVGTNAIEIYVHRIRKKLQDSGVTIRTIRGLGYLMEPASGTIGTT